MSRRIPRLEMEQLAPAVVEALTPRVKRLGYLGEFFKCAGHQPEALLAFIQFTESAKAELPKRVVEIIALTVATRLENAYERHQHERLSVRLGFGRDWVASVEKLEPAGLEPVEAAVQAYVLKALERTGHGAGDAFEAVIDALGHERAVAVMMVVGRYTTHSLFVNTVGLAPPVPSIWEDGFDGSP